MKHQIAIWTLFSLVCLSLMSNKAHAIGFDTIDENEFKDIISEFGASYTHRSVSPASSLGKIFGFELGLIAGSTNAPTIEKKAKEGDPNSDLKALPHADLLAVVTFPFGISGELNFLPEIKNSDIDFRTASIAAKWTITDIWELPVDLAVKIHGGASHLKWNQPISTGATDLEYDQASSGMQIQVSKKFTIFEPYITVGSLRTKGKLSSPSGTTVFDPAYTAASSSEEEVAGSQFILGANLNLAFVKFGLEFENALGTQSFNLKTSLYF